MDGNGSATQKSPFANKLPSRAIRVSNFALELFLSAANFPFSRQLFTQPAFFTLILKILGFCHCWARGFSLSDSANELDLSLKTAVDWSSFCREICLKAFVEQHQQLGGEGRTVEIDESKFGRRKFWRGHRVEGVWVFGGIERETGRVFMETVEKRWVLG